MKKIILTTVLLAATFFAFPSHGQEPSEEPSEEPSQESSGSWVKGDFSMAGYFNAGIGWQRFTGGTPTEFTNDCTTAGVLGSVIPDAINCTLPSKDQDNFEAFMEVFELDIAKAFGERASLVAHTLFGRSQSGSWLGTPGVDIEQAYATVMLWKAYDVQLAVGRIGTEAGFEEFEPYNNDTISWSILSNSNIYPAIITGAQISAQLTDNVALYLAVANNLTDDTTFKVNSTPSGMASLEFTWGDESAENYFVISPFGGPESNGDKPITFGVDATLSMWPVEDLQLGFETTYRIDYGIDDNPNTSYVSALLNLHWNMTDNFYTFLKYSYANQFDDGNGYFNLTGAKQQIHEMSLGLGYFIADGMKLKLETRLDAVDPSGFRAQWVPGVAMALASAF